MNVFYRFIFGARLKKILNAPIPLPLPTVNQTVGGLSVLGAVGLAFVCGAAVMFFQLPSSDFLDKSFAGAQAWYERGRSTIPLLPPEVAAEMRQGVFVDRADKTYDGFTLFTMTDAAQATLIDMRGTVVHRWQLPFSQAYAHLHHIKSPVCDDQIHWFRCHLYRNGDLLAIYHADGDTPYGYGLVKLDKDSKLLWAYADNVHHDVDVAEDGTIFTLTQKLSRALPPGLESLPAPYIADAVVVLAPEGRELQSFPILEAFANSPYGSIVDSIEDSAPSVNAFDLKATLPLPFPARPRLKGDLLHTNSVKVLNRSLASKFPLFQPGQVLLSMRNLNTIAVLDRSTRRMAWAAQGVWRLQHDANFLDNGHLLLYDNLGAKKTRVLEYDPQTQAIHWGYTDETFRADSHGVKQRLPNGNTLIADPHNRRLFEVTPSKELTWEYFCPLSPESINGYRRSHAVSSAQRYGANELTFLASGIRARP